MAVDTWLSPQLKHDCYLMPVVKGFLFVVLIEATILYSSFQNSDPMLGANIVEQQ